MDQPVEGRRWRGLAPARTQSAQSRARRSRRMQILIAVLVQVLAAFQLPPRWP